MVLGLVVALGASAMFLLLSGQGQGPAQGPEKGSAPPEQEPGPAPTGVGALGAVAPGELLVRGELTGTTTLSNPEINTMKVPVDTPSQWCALLTEADILGATGFDQRGVPEAGLICTYYLTDDTDGTAAGYLMVSDIPAAAGMSYLVRGNSAIVFQRDPAACEVSVALNHGGGVLDIDIRGVVSPTTAPTVAPTVAPTTASTTASTTALCGVATLLATRAFDRLPDA